MDINSAYSDIEVFLAYFWKIYFLNTTLLYIIEFSKYNFIIYYWMLQRHFKIFKIGKEEWDFEKYNVFEKSDYTVKYIQNHNIKLLFFFIT